MHRLLLITENYPPDGGGMSVSCDRIVRGLVHAGVAVDVVHFDRRTSRPQLRRTTTGAHLRWPVEGDPAHAINCVWNRVRQTMAPEGATHVLAFGGTLPLLSAPAFAAWIGRPLVTLLRGNELDAGLFDPRRRAILDDALRRSAAVCTVTSEHAEKVAALYPDLSPRVIANGIDTSSWEATSGDHERAGIWRSREVEPGRRVLGFFGHLKAKKGVPLFIDVLQRSGLSSRFHLLLVGEADAELQALLDRSTDLAVTRMPAVERFDLLPYYLASDLVVLPSHYDGFPNVLIEAAALGRPLLASATGGMRDLLTDGESAFLFEPGDEHGCRLAIARAAAADDSVLNAMGRQAREAALQRCNALAETRAYLEVLDATVPSIRGLRSLDAP
jgi:glycosyltransferase involved in cell wall biosynthesis